MKKKLISVLLCAAMGIFEALNGSGIDDVTKVTFIGNKSVITGCGGFSVIVFNKTNNIFLTLIFAVVFSAICGFVILLLVIFIQVMGPRLKKNK